ncbi:uncharacterized protein TM35_000033460 [Trypanosoma theileri]|uniref:RRM domain-containing protein n=1 Tax=Trypanosoma theileri TaxID=67003 RepID=A0A1X0P7J4_9TRYP|nr:uncharacterized protein TM35_000033460 [Trypanosoma theileri]ORC92593.1 hypothetical protein TM35_000033460 [Trypanosoma theileri]
MSVRDDARVIHVYVEDQSVVLADDVHDWLKIIDEVDEMKVQYDTAQQRLFYWVRFKHVFAAQQAVNYLDGERLKNTVVHITSNFYTKRSPVSINEVNDVKEALEKEQRIPEKLNLPMNHQMPSDLQMDAALVNTIPVLLSDSEKKNEYQELVQKLKKLQETYFHVQKTLEKTEEDIHKTDEEVKKLLLGNNNNNNNNNNNSDLTEKKTEDEGDDIVDEKGENGQSRRIHNTVYIPISLCDPASIITKLAKYVGPITDYIFLLSPEKNSFQAVVEFFHANDAILALQILTGGLDEASMIGKKRRRLDENVEEVFLSLSSFGWTNDTSVGPLHFLYDPSVVLLAAKGNAINATTMDSCL